VAHFCIKLKIVTQKKTAEKKWTLTQREIRILSLYSIVVTFKANKLLKKIKAPLFSIVCKTKKKYRRSLKF